MFNSKQLKVVPTIEKLDISKNARERFSKLIQQATISYSTHIDTAAFIQQDSLIQAQYPLVHSILDRKTINDYSLVYKWKGKDESLLPILFLGHLDVVPIEENSLALWEQAPFSGHIDEEHIWGRGSLDDKINVVGVLEAISLLLEDEIQPMRDVYLAFGHDEEVGGAKGAVAIADYFKKQDLRFEYILDEGLVILKEALKGLDAPLAMIGIAEKGYTNLGLEIDLKEGGHSAMPSDENAIGLLSKAIHRLQSNQFPAKINGASEGLFEYAGPEMNFPYNTLFSNLWLTKGLLKKQLLSDPTSASLIRTTTAPTIVRSGIKENVMPAQASANINFRIMPGETVTSVVQRVKKVIGDSRIKVKIKDDFSSDPSSLSSTNSFGFRAIQRTLQEIYPQTIISPGLVIAATDSRHYMDLADDIYRFTPMIIDRTDLKGIHGNNEHISIENFENAIRFYRQLIVNSSK